MSFSYTLGANPAIDYPRLLLSDTVNNPPTQPCIFQDEEITSAARIVGSVWQSSQFYSGASSSGQTIGTSGPSNYLRQSALLLNAVAANKSRLASIKQLLDVKLDSSDAAIQMRETAQFYLDMDDNSGAFFIAEQVHTVWSFRDRFWAQVQRQSGGGLGIG